MGLSETDGSRHTRCRVRRTSAVPCLPRLVKTVGGRFEGGFLVKGSRGRSEEGGRGSREGELGFLHHENPCID